MWSVPHANEQWETGNAAGNQNSRQWTTADLVQCHPRWPDICQSWYILMTDFTAQCQRDRDWERGRDCLSLKHILSYRSSVFLQTVNAWDLSNCVWGRYFVYKCTFSTYLRPLASQSSTLSAACLSMLMTQSLCLQHNPCQTTAAQSHHSVSITITTSTENKTFHKDLTLLL